MNEQENTRLVQQAYKKIQTGDIQAVLNSFAEDVQWQLPEMGNVPFAGTWRGREGVSQFFNKVFEVQDVVEFEPQEYVAQGDKVVVLGRFLMRIKSTGGEFRSDWAHVWTGRRRQSDSFQRIRGHRRRKPSAQAAQTAAKTGRQKIRVTSVSDRSRKKKKVNQCGY